MRRVELLAVLCVLLAVACESGAGSRTDTMPATAAATTTVVPPSTDGTTTTSTPEDGWLPTVHDDTGSGWMVTPGGVWVSEPMVRGEVWYAKVVGISLEEARRRNGLVEEVTVGRFARRLQRLDGRGGVWTEETADSWHLVVATNEAMATAQQQLDRLLRGSAVLDSVVIRQVEYSLSNLKGRLSGLGRLVDRWCLPPMTDSAIDLYGNRVVVGAQDPHEFVAAAENVGADLAGIVVVEHRVDPPPERGTGCGMVDPAELYAAQVLWQSHGIEAYRFVVLGRGAWGPWGRYLVSVTGDTVAIEVLDPGQFDGTWEQGGFDGMFDWAAANWEPGVLAIRTHPEWGFIVSVRYDHPGWIDEEWSYWIRAWAPDGQPLTLVDEDDRPCSFRLDRIMEGHPADDRGHIRQAVRMAVWDPALQEFLLRLGSGQCSVKTVDLNDDTIAVVKATFGPLADGNQWPLETCTDDVHQVGAIRWTVDLEQETILEACGY